MPNLPGTRAVLLPHSNSVPARVPDRCSQLAGRAPRALCSAWGGAAAASTGLERVESAYCYSGRHLQPPCTAQRSQPVGTAQEDISVPPKRVFLSLERGASLGSTPQRAQPRADCAAVAAQVRVLELALQRKEEELAMKGKKVPALGQTLASCMLLSRGAAARASPYSLHVTATLMTAMCTRLSLRHALTSKCKLCNRLQKYLPETAQHHSVTLYIGVTTMHSAWISLHLGTGGQATRKAAQ